MTEPLVEPNDEDLASWRIALAQRAFNDAWRLLDQGSLTREEEEEMLSASLTQRYHWYQVGRPRNQAIGDWQVSRVAAVLGYAELASRFGERSLALAREHDLGPFVTGFAHEAIARAAACVDDIATFTEHLDAARALLADVEDPEERETLEADLAEMSER